MTWRSLSEFLCASFLCYPPEERILGDVARNMHRFILDRIKKDAPMEDGRMAIDYAISRLAERAVGTFLETFFDGAVLVPTPGHKKQPTERPFHWPAERICEQLVLHGMGTEIHACVYRAKTVASSKGSAPGERPSPEEHFQSLEIRDAPRLLQPERIIIVDDVVTRGSTMVAVAATVRTLFQSSRIAGFALASTLPGWEEFRAPVDMMLSRITPYDSGKLFRERIPDAEISAVLDTIGW